MLRTVGAASTLAALAAALLVFPVASSAVSGGQYPALYIISSAGGLTDPVNLEFDAEHLDSADETARFDVIVPNDYGANLTLAPGKSLGPVDIFTSSGPSAAQKTHFQGTVHVIALSTYAVRATAQFCSPAQPVAAWEFDVKSTSGDAISIPIAVYHDSTFGYVLRMCFSDLHARQLYLSQLDFNINGVFTNPEVPGDYLFDSAVVPFAADGTPDTSTAYELLGFEDLPSTLSALARYDPTTKTFALQGALTENGQTRSDFAVDVYTGPTANGPWTEIGAATTDATGKYFFSKRLAPRPSFAFASAIANSYPTCSGGSSAPRGCPSHTLDGAISIVADTTPPRVLAIASSGHTGAIVQLHYRLWENSHHTREQIRVLHLGKVITTLNTTLAPITNGHNYYVNWPAPATTYSNLSFCVVATNPSGNASAPSCAALQLAGGR